MENLEFYREFSDMGVEKLVFVQQMMDKAPVGRFLEIGTNEGGTALMAIDSENSNEVISVDPYGGVDFIGLGGGISEYRFDDRKYTRAMALLYKRAWEKNKVFIQYKTTSASFLDSTLDFWSNTQKTTIEQLTFSFVLLDGDHTTANVINELAKLQKRMVKGGVVLIDNVDWLDRELLPAYESLRFDMAAINY